MTWADQDSLNAAAGGNLLTRNTEEAFQIFENKARVRTSRNKMQNSKVQNDDSNSAMALMMKEFMAKMSTENELVRGELKALKEGKQVNVINNTCETCGGPHPYYECQATEAYPQEEVHAMNMGGNSYRPQGDRSLLSYRSNNALGPPPGFNQPVQSQNRNPPRPNHHVQNSGFYQSQNRGFQGNQNQRDFQRNTNSGNFQGYGNQSSQHDNQAFGNNNYGQSSNNYQEVAPNTSNIESMFQKMMEENKNQFQKMNEDNKNEFRKLNESNRNQADFSRTLRKDLTDLQKHLNE